MIKLTVDPKNTLNALIKRLDSLFPGEPVELVLEGITTSRRTIYLGAGNYVNGLPFMYTKIRHED